MSKPTESKLPTAYHEAGHAVIAYCRGWELLTVTITEWNGHAGMTQSKRIPFINLMANTDALDDDESNIVELLAGDCAEQKFVGRITSPHSAELDMREVHQLLRKHCGNDAEQTNRKLERLREFTASLFELPNVWSAVKAVAEALERQTTLKGHVAELIIQNHLQSSPSQRRKLVRPDIL